MLLRGLEAGLQLVEALVERLDVRAGGDHPFNREKAGDALDVVGGKRRERIVDRDGELLVGLRDGDDAMLGAKGPDSAPVTTSRSSSSGLILTNRSPANAASASPTCASVASPSFTIACTTGVVVPRVCRRTRSACSRVSVFLKTRICRRSPASEDAAGAGLCGRLLGGGMAIECDRLSLRCIG